MTAGRLIVRGAALSTGGLVVRLGARLMFLVIAGQLYGAALFGAYSLAVAAVELAVAIGGLGMKRLVFQHLDERGERPEAHVLADMLLLVGATSVVLAAGLIAAVASAPATMISANTAAALLILAPAIVGQALIDVLLAATRWKHVMRFEVAGRSLVEPYVAVVAAALAFYAGFGERGLLVAYWAGTLAALAFAAAGVATTFGAGGLSGYRASAARMVPMFRGALPNTAADALSGFFLRADLYLVGILLGERPAGIYGMARQLAIPVRQVRQSFDGLLAPLVARTLQAAGTATAGRAIASAARLILALQFPFLIGLVAFGLPLLGWLGPEFATGWAAAVLIACAEAVQGAFGVGELMFVYRRPRLGLLVMIGTVALGLALGLAFTLAWGLTGAGAAVLLTSLARAAARRAAIRASLGVAVPLRHVSGAAAAGIAGGAAAYALAPWGWPLALAGGLALYGALLLLWLRLTGESLALRDFSA